MTRCLAALALACALALLWLIHPALGIVAALLLASTALGLVSRLPITGVPLAALTALLLMPLAAHADVAVPVTTISLPWGDWLVAAMQPVTAALVPLAAAAIVGGIAKVAPWAASILTRQRVEAAIQAGASYGMNAIPGVVKGKAITVNLGSAVVAAGAQHLIDEAPARVIKAAGGPEGIAARIFRSLPLDENSSAQNVLEPALERLKNGTARAA